MKTYVPMMIAYNKELIFILVTANSSLLDQYGGGENLIQSNKKTTIFALRRQKNHGFLF